MLRAGERLLPLGYPRRPDGSQMAERAGAPPKSKIDGVIWHMGAQSPADAPHKTLLLFDFLCL
jgi:hypothetical protein